MNSASQRIMEVLLRYLSPSNAEGTLLRSISEAGLKSETLTLNDVPLLLPVLDRRIRLYLDPLRHARVSAELATIGAQLPQRRTRTVVVKIELDISEARRVAKEVCEGAAARSFIVHKVVTIVSELARNIVHYTPGGTIEVAVVRDKPARFSVIATDNGPGIANLDEIMSGRYKSRTGMGRGLMGIKRLADRFKINPGPPGTRVELEVNL
ncbi:anti-sigma B factor RsbT [Minicystis rosea]|nr:anti-sigma B factor RsbT [Minicystis rosea]